MRISTRGRYALRVMLDVALNATGGPVSLKSVSARQDISTKYIEQIVPELVRAGLLYSKRGAQGGYMLGEDPRAITVGRVLRLAEGSLAPVVCLDDYDCPRKDSCLTVDLWRRVDRAVEEVVDSVTLQDLIDDARRKGLIDMSQMCPADRSDPERAQ